MSTYSCVCSNRRAVAWPRFLFVRGKGGIKSYELKRYSEQDSDTINDNDEWLKTSRRSKTTRECMQKIVEGHVKLRDKKVWNVVGSAARSPPFTLEKRRRLVHIENK